MIVRRKLWKRYVDSFPAKQAKIEGAIAGLESGEDPDGTSLRELSHQLAGSGGTYGFPHLTQLARALELAPASEIGDAARTLTGYLTRTHRELMTDLAGSLLIVEDNPDVASAMAEATRGLVRDVIVVGSAAALRKALEEHEPSAILLDLVLPDLDGRSLLVELRDTIDLAHIPVIVITAHTAPGVRAECIRLGVHRFLHKPVDPDLLDASVRQALTARREFVAEARRDPLTGLRNRSGLHDALAALRRAGSADGPISVALLDIDHFKRINDGHGHMAGDVVLQRFGRLLEDALRTTDVCGRWGGEEFVAILPATTPDVARRLLESLQTEARNYVVECGPSRVDGIRFSAGIERLEAKDTLDEALSGADQLLYLAKETGRDRVITRSDPAPTALAPRILVADDDPDTAGAVGSLLDQAGFRVETRGNGGAALLRAQEVAFDAVVLDWQMPEMAGDEVLARLRELPSYARVPILMLTSVGDEEHVTRAFDLGADDYIQKPLRPRELVARLRRCLARR